MTSARWRRAKDLFVDASELPEAERVAFLDDACGDDHELRRQVERLLAGDRKAAADILDAGAPVDLLEEAMATGGSGTIGPFRILETLGEGGMGRVYLAEQTAPVQRRVALKLIKLGMDMDQVLARFEVERQALAMMEHDNIAKVFDAGTTETGQPYFVMEYVPGIPLTTHCDEQQLSTRERLELFTQVCAGVQHAHQKGVIHRDLKPSNILVTRQTGQAHLPKIIDFGIAKATDSGRILAATQFTVQGQVVGTPQYMSPSRRTRPPATSTPGPTSFPWG